MILEGECAALKARGFVARAKKAVSVLPGAEAKAALFELADFALARIRVMVPP